MPKLFLQKIFAILAILLSTDELVCVRGEPFTYQGLLMAEGTPANGSYDLRFEVYTAATDGVRLGETVTNASALISNGLFTVEVDPGEFVSTGELWLEVAVRERSDTSEFTVLQPRHHLIATPLASYARAAGALVGVLPDAQLSTNVARLDEPQTFTSPISIVQTQSMPPFVILGSSAATNLLQIRSAQLDGRTVMSLGPKGGLSINRGGTTPEAMIHLGPPTNHNNTFMRFEANNPPGQSAGWMFGQGYAPNPIGPDKNKIWTWGYNVTYSTTNFGSKQSPDEPRFSWNLECNWEPFPNGSLRQMEHYISYVSRSNDLNVRPWGLTVRDAVDLENDVHVDRMSMHGVSGSNDSAVVFNVSRSPNSGATLNLRGQIQVLTNAANDGGISLLGGPVQFFAKGNNAKQARILVSKSAPYPLEIDGRNSLIALNIQGFTSSQFFVPVMVFSNFSVAKTITPAGTTGDTTINKLSGSVNFAAGDTRLYATNSFVNPNSVVTATIASDDESAAGLRAVPQQGQILFILREAPASEMRVNFHVWN